MADKNDKEKLELAPEDWQLLHEIAGEQVAALQKRPAKPDTDKKTGTFAERVAARKAEREKNTQKSLQVKPGPGDQVAAIRALLADRRKTTPGSPTGTVMPSSDAPDFEKEFGATCDKLRVPAENRELLQAILLQGSSDEGINLEKIVPELLKKHPILTRSTKYPTVVRGDTAKPEKKDIANASMNERKELLRKELGAS